IDCANQKIEEMTAVQVTGCHRAPSTTETFQRLDDVLNALRGKLVVQLDVKVTSDYARTIAVIVAKNAQDFAFLEISTADLTNLIPTVPDSDKVYYLVNVGGALSDVDGLLALHNPRAFMYEFDPGVQLGTLPTTRLHPAGVRTFTYDSSKTASEQE